MHCVQAYGALRGYLAALLPAAAPTRIMLHSYGGSAEMVSAFTSIGAGPQQRPPEPGADQESGGAQAGCGGGGGDRVGNRIYFSFSWVLCKKSPKKAAARIAAVPADRLLLETDLTETDGMNDALCAIAEFAAAAKGWSVDETVRRTWQNFEAFYAGAL
jgi:TatD DNase family protein